MYTFCYRDVIVYESALYAKCFVKGILDKTSNRTLYIHEYNAI